MLQPRPVQIRLQSAIKKPGCEHFRKFNEFKGFQPATKFSIGEEPIIIAIDLPRSRGSSRRRDRLDQFHRSAVHQFPHQRGFSAAAGTRKDHNSLVMNHERCSKRCPSSRQTQISGQPRRWDSTSRPVNRHFATPRSAKPHASVRWRLSFRRRSEQSLPGLPSSRSC